MILRISSFFILLICALQSHAFSWHEMWINKNQRAKEMLKNNNYKQAQQTFKDPNWQAVAAYRAGNYQLAADLLSKSQAKNAEYNLGNALAKLGKYQEAIAAYDMALAKEHKNQDAEYNRDLVKKILEQQKNQQQPPKEPPKDSQQQQQQKGDKSDPSSEQKQNPSPPKDDKNSDEKNKKQKDKDIKQNDSKPQNNQAKPQNSKPEEKSGGAKQQMKEQWLKLIPDDPGGLLREKFKRDYLRKRGEA